MDAGTTKLIHFAAFGRSVLSRYGFQVEPVVDTMELSRAARGMDAEGGHALSEVCRRELGQPLDKSEQTSDWARRPLSEEQVAYAALEAEVLLRLVELLR